MRKIKARPMHTPKKEDDARKIVRGKIRTFHINEGLPQIPAIQEELIDMTNVLLGRDDPPINHGTMTLYEVADAYYARASELTMLIQQAERLGTVPKNSNYYRLRTGELRTFMEMAKRAADLGSRRLSDEALQLEREALGRESR